MEEIVPLKAEHWNIHLILTDYSWLLFVVVSFCTSIYVCRNSFLFIIVRDKMDKKRQAKIKEYKSLLEARDQLKYHIGWSKQDKDHRAVTRMQSELESLEEKIEETEEWLYLKNPDAK